VRDACMSRCENWVILERRDDLMKSRLNAGTGKCVVVHLADLRSMPFVGRSAKGGRQRS
jgi:hypothetical protein